MPLILCHEFRYYRFRPTSSTTERRHTITCTMGAYRLLTCSIIIDHHCLYLLETSIVVSRSCTWNVLYFVTYVKVWFVELFIIIVITNFKLHLQLFKFTKVLPRIICHEFRYCRFRPTSSTTERRHTIACTIGAYKLLSCTIIIDHLLL